MRENSVKAEADAVPDAGNAYTAATSQSHGKTGIVAADTADACSDADIGLLLSPAAI